MVQPNPDLTGSHARPLRPLLRPRTHRARHRRRDGPRAGLRRGAAFRRRAGADRLAQGGGLRSGGEGAFGARALRGLRRHGRDRGRRRGARRRDAQADGRPPHPRQQRRAELGRAVRDFSLESLGAGDERERGRPFFADPRPRADAGRLRQRRPALDRRQHRLGDGQRHPVRARLFLCGLEGRRASPDPHSGGGVRRPAGDDQRHRAGAVSDQHDALRHRRRGGRGARRESGADGPARPPRGHRRRAPVPGRARRRLHDRGDRAGRRRVGVAAPPPMFGGEE